MVKAFKASPSDCNNRPFNSSSNCDLHSHHFDCHAIIWIGGCRPQPAHNNAPLFTSVPLAFFGQND